jgi:hypothetical protein
MAKIVRLTENDLMRIVKKVIREQSSNDCDNFVETFENITNKYYSKLNSLPEVGTSSWDNFQDYSKNVDIIVERYRNEYLDFITPNLDCVTNNREIFDMVDNLLNLSESMKNDALKTFKNATKLGDIKSTGNKYGGFGPQFYDETEIGAYTKMGKDFDDDGFDTEEFSDFESYREKYPRRTSGVRWFNSDPDDTKNKESFNTYQRNTGGKPFKVKTRKMRD